MNEERHFIPVTPTDDPKRLKHNGVQVNVSYAKGRGISASAYPAERKPGGVVMLTITSGKYLPLEPAARLNRKRVAHWEDEAARQLGARCGPVWDLVLSLVARENLTLPQRQTEAVT